MCHHSLLQEIVILLVVIPCMLGWLLGGLCQVANNVHVNWRVWHEEASYHVGSLVEMFPRGRLVYEQTCSNLCIFEGRLFRRFVSWRRVVMHALHVVGLSPTNVLSMLRVLYSPRWFVVDKVLDGWPRYVVGESYCLLFTNGILGVLVLWSLPIENKLDNKVWLA